MAAPSSRWASQAKINALLRYAPEREALQQQLSEARQVHDSTIAGAKSSGVLTSQAVEAAKPEVAGIYGREAAGTSATQSQLAAALAALPGAAGYRAAAATTSAAGQERQGRERGAAESGLVQQDVAAKEAPAFGRTLADQQLAASLSKILASSKGVAANEGAATASELAKLEEQAEGRAVTERGQNLTAKSSAEGRAQKAVEHQEDLAQKRSEGANGTPITRKEQSEGASTIQEIKQFAAKVKGDRAQRVAKLTVGEPGQSVKEGTETVKEPGRPAFKPDVLMSAALDLSEYGRLTPHTEHRLSEAGYNVGKLGIPRSKAVAPGTLGKNVQRAITGF